MLFFDTQYNFFLFNLVMLFRIFWIINFIIYFSFFGLLATLFWIIVMNILWNSYMVLKNIKDFPYKITYSLIYEFFWAFTYFEVLWKIKEQGKWVTR